MSFAILIITPISTVAIGLAISLTKVYLAGAASHGCRDYGSMQIWATYKRNKPGVPTAVLGAMRMMMP